MNSQLKPGKLYKVDQSLYVFKTPDSRLHPKGSILLKYDDIVMYINTTEGFGLRYTIKFDVLLYKNKIVYSDYLFDFLKEIKC